MTDERKIITEDRDKRPDWFDGGDCDFAEWWDSLPDAPKHTDKEYDVLFKQMQSNGEDATYWLLENAKLEVWIKELEAELIRVDKVSREEGDL